ncbi:thioredoxin family protein [Fulvivirgaceae bacterium BMA12]|uniref:Thioredoxin family protein n=1 Tax=Agaribacillus aureus TaxID=3051825 RepID=A0ABT8LD99_9BACT|nr:thioredoxin family protein [Fulvivirgaceae bacterium BMA12]
MKKTYLTIMAMLLIAVFTNATFEGNGYSVGDYAIDFKLKGVDGKMVSMSDYSKANGIVVIFTCNTCPYSKLYEDRIIAINDKYTPQGFPVIAINPNDPKVQPGDTYQLMQQRAKDKGFTFPYLVDETQEVAKAYGATRTPHVYLLKKENNKFKVAYIGAIDNNHKSAEDASEKYLENAINALKAGKKVSTDFTKAVGCTIKWKEA